MDFSSVSIFYNASRTPFKPTTLYNGNMPQEQFDYVINDRKSLLTCYESMPTTSQQKLKLHKKCHNKENNK